MIPWGTTTLLSARNLRFGWDHNNVIDLPSFDLAPGERVFVSGRSGSGKSTLLGLLAGVHRPREGHVRLDDTVLSALPAAARDQLRADRIGYVFQQFNLLSYLNVLDNVLLGCAFSPYRQQRAGGKQGARLEARRLLGALGLDAPTWETRPVTSLSTGQQQRVAVARALIGSPDLVIADEPTSALDADARDAFIGLLLAESARSGSGVVFVSHDRSLAHHFDRMLELDTHAVDGRT